jgi:hypothetical protein
MTSPKYLRPRDASAYLRTVFGIKRTPNTLCKDRCLGGGPEFVRFGREVLYPVEALHEWVAAKVSERVASTSAELRKSRSSPPRGVFGRTADAPAG